MYSSKIVTVYWLVYLNEKVEKGLSLKKKVIVDYERYNYYMTFSRTFQRGYGTMIILMAVLGEFCAIAINQCLYYNHGLKSLGQ